MDCITLTEESERDGEPDAGKSVNEVKVTKESYFKIPSSDMRAISKF